MLKKRYAVIERTGTDKNQGISWPQNNQIFRERRSLVLSLHHSDDIFVTYLYFEVLPEQV